MIVEVLRVAPDEKPESSSLEVWTDGATILLRSTVTINRLRPASARAVARRLYRLAKEVEHGQR